MSMGCPYCSDERTAVISTREEPAGIRRRRKCPRCGGRFWTVERIAMMDAPPSGVVPRKRHPRQSYAGDQAYIRLAVARFTARWGVSCPADATANNPDALQDWCDTLAKFRGDWVPTTKE